MEETSKYFAVFYSTDGTIHLWPGDNQEVCLEKLKDMSIEEGIIDRLKATTVIKRDMSKFKDGMIFGCPKSLNIATSKKIQKMKEGR